jgi:hypothetical protein
MRGASGKIIRDFVRNLEQVTALAEETMIQELCGLIEDNRRYLTEPFLRSRMEQAKAVDQVLGAML